MEINGFSSMNLLTVMSGEEDQQDTLVEILAKYDAENLSAQDKKSLVQDLKDAGIQRNSRAMKTLREAGIDLDRTQEETAASGSSEATRGDMWNLYLQYQSGEISESEFQELIKGQMAAAGSLLSVAF